MTSTAGGGRRLAASGPAAMGVVWQRYTQPALWPSWAPHLRRVEYAHRVVTPGTSGRVVGVGGVSATFHIDAVDATAGTWSWSVTVGPLRLSFDHGVEAASGDGASTTAWAVVRGPRPVVLAYAPLARWALGRLVGLRRSAERWASGLTHR